MAKASLYGQYVKEKEGRGIIEGKDYFLTYKFEKEWCYIVDMYVAPKVRSEGLITKISLECEEIARKAGYTKMLGSVDITSNWAEPPAIGMMRHGYKFFKLVGNIIYFLKDLNKEHTDTFKNIKGE
jgi:GNAT superfamily N-acetyltransferase